MAKYQFPPLKDERLFEELICDLFNTLENTESYSNIDFQHFGVKGQNQKGIDIFSNKSRTAIQCKVKDLRKSDGVIRSSLIDDITNDLEKTKDLEFTFDRFIIASTFRDDTHIQEFLNRVSETENYRFNMYYLGWDTISKHIEECEGIVDKYYPKFRPKRAITPKPELPENSLGKDLIKKNYATYLIKRYGDWKQIELARTGEKFNWAAFNIHLAKKFHAVGINHIHVGHFEDLVAYIQGRIDKTAFGRNNKARGSRNYSTLDEHQKGITD
jgi:hypothetical protein